LGIGSAIGAQEDTRASEVLASTRKALGGGTLESLRSLSVQATVQRNVGDFQIASELELLLELPDKYMRSEASSGPIGAMSNNMGFNGDRPLKSTASAGMTPGGGMVIRMGGPGAALPAGAEKPTPEQQQQIDRQIVRSSRHEIGRLLLGWAGKAHPSLKARYAFAGQAESPDGTAHVIDVQNADGFSARLFIDEKTRLPLMVTYQGPQPRTITARGSRPAARGTLDQRPLSAEERKQLTAGAEQQIRDLQQQAPVLVEYTLFFEDWREAGGIMFPHALRRAQAGATTEEWTINRVAVNPRIDPKKFETQNQERGPG
jgi:hypothetical protein